MLPGKLQVESCVLESCGQTSPEAWWGGRDSHSPTLVLGPALEDYVPLAGATAKALRPEGATAALELVHVHHARAEQRSGFPP